MSTDDAKAVRVFLLVEDEQSRAILLPVGSVYVDEHLNSVHEKDDSLVLVEATLEFLLEQRVYFHLN